MKVLHKNKFLQTAPTDVIMRLSNIAFYFDEYIDEQLWYKSVCNKYVLRVMPTDTLHLGNPIFYWQIVGEEHVVYTIH